MRTILGVFWQVKDKEYQYSFTLRYIDIKIANKEDYWNSNYIIAAINLRRDIILNLKEKVYIIHILFLISLAYSDTGHFDFYALCHCENKPGSLQPFY